MSFVWLDRCMVAAGGVVPFEQLLQAVSIAY